MRTIASLARRTSVRAFALLALVAMIAAARIEREPISAAPESGPGFGSPEAVLAIARTLSFDSISGDTRRLMVTDPATGIRTYGPLALIEPEINSHAISRQQLGRGHVLARLVNLDNVGYPSLALAPRDTAYWWVDSVATGQWRSRLVPVRGDVPAVTGGLHITLHPGHTWSQPSSRFRWSETRTGTWVACVWHGCCYLE
jgi:hypothetical protein